MIKEIVKFMELLPENFKMKGTQPKDGLHIEVRMELSPDYVSNIDTENFIYEMYSSKKGMSSPFLDKCKERHQNAWCIDTNKCFDLPTKAIHSCSPFLVAFKREHLKGGDKFIDNQKKQKTQIYDRFNNYFEKAGALFDEEDNKDIYDVFKYFFVRDEFSIILSKIEQEQSSKRLELEDQIESKKILDKSSNDKQVKNKIREEIKQLEIQLNNARSLSNGDYILFYLDVPLQMYSKTHDNYLKARLFNTDEYNTEPDSEGLVYGTSNFLNGFNNKMPFLMHQTASFDITSRISNVDAKLLYEFAKILPNKTLPNPLPLFVYEEELELQMLALIQEDQSKLGYQDLVNKLIIEHKKDLGNYYLLFWQNTKDGLVFRDFDFVSKFEFNLEENIDIINYFEVKEKEGKGLKSYSKIMNIFDFEQTVLKPFIYNKYHNLNYFSDLSKEGYEEMDGTYQSYAKYRKTVYDYVYKSQRTLINQYIFYEMVFNAIKDDLKLARGSGIKDKLNIWYSTQHIFNQKNKEFMGDKLKDYQSFVEKLTSEEGIQTEATDAYFAFTAGMVINYIISKSQAADASYQLLEPYLQQSRCTEFKKAIARDFARYKHERFSKRFDRAAAFVLSYETEASLKDLLPQILSGVFAKNQLYSKQ